MLKKLFSVCVLLSIASCAQIKHSNLTRTDLALDPTKLVIIEVPQDGQYKHINYASSGTKVLNVLRKEFIQHAQDIKVIDACESTECIENLKENISGYLVKPKILHWEDRETQWSFRPDIIEIELSIIDLATGKEVRNTIYKAKSRQIQFFAGSSPEDLLDRPTREAVFALYN